MSTLSAGCGEIGAQVGAYLDAQDREKMNEAAQAALKTGKVQTWSSDDTGASGSVRILKAGSTAAGGRAGCRTLRRATTLPDGSQRQDDVLACKNSAGKWVPEEI